jgi:hypothetical protein
MDGLWKPQFYISKAMLERFPVEHLRLLLLGQRARLNWDRGLFNLKPKSPAGLAGLIICFYTLALINPDPPTTAWSGPVLGLLGVVAFYHTRVMLRSNERSSDALADRGVSRVLGPGLEPYRTYAQAVTMYDYHRHLPNVRRKRLEQRLNFILSDRQHIAEWIDAYEAHLNSGREQQD